MYINQLSQKDQSTSQTLTVYYDSYNCACGDIGWHHVPAMNIFHYEYYPMYICMYAELNYVHQCTCGVCTHLASSLNDIHH